MSDEIWQNTFCALIVQSKIQYNGTEVVIKLYRGLKQLEMRLQDIRLILRVSYFTGKRICSFVQRAQI